MFKYKESSEPWQTLNEGELYLPNLNYGQYHLEIIGKNEITNEFTNPRDILFEIKPPWYLTLWFKALLALLGALILFILYKYRIRQINAKLKIEKQYHEMITGTEMQNLRSQMNPHFIFNSWIVSTVMLWKITQSWLLIISPNLPDCFGWFLKTANMNLSRWARNWKL